MAKPSYVWYQEASAYHSLPTGTSLINDQLPCSVQDASDHFQNSQNLPSCRTPLLLCSPVTVLPIGAKPSEDATTQTSKINSGQFTGVLYGVSTLWNGMSEHIRKACMLKQFHKMFKIKLFGRAFLWSSKTVMQLISLGSY